MLLVRLISDSMCVIPLYGEFRIMMIVDWFVVYCEVLFSFLFCDAPWFVYPQFACLLSGLIAHFVTDFVGKLYISLNVRTLKKKLGTGYLVL